ncbi:MAG TPA: hypothetical protein VF678_03150 [bacterium]
MKTLAVSVASALLLASLTAVPATAGAGEMGAFITLVNTYAYPKGPRKGDRILIRSRIAGPVVNQAFDDGDLLWYEVLMADRTDRIDGIGWTPLTAQELLGRGSEGIPVYSRPLDANFRSFQTVVVPANDVDLAHETQRSEDFPQVEWQKVRYSSRLPQTVWVRASAGIYRVGRSQAFLTQSYAEMATRSVQKETASRLLSGIVKPGDSAQEVRWALGDPLKTGDETTGNKQTVWEYTEAKIRFENAVVKSVE